MGILTNFGFFIILQLVAGWLVSCQLNFERGVNYQYYQNGDGSGNGNGDGRGGSSNFFFDRQGRHGAAAGQASALEGQNFGSGSGRRPSKIRFEDRANPLPFTPAATPTPSHLQTQRPSFAQLTQKISQSGSTGSTDGRFVFPTSAASIASKQPTTRPISTSSVPVGESCTDFNGLQQGTCQDYIKCAIYQAEYLTMKKTSRVSSIKCSLADGRQGICCPTVLKNKDVSSTDLAFGKKKPKHDGNLEVRFGGFSSVQKNINSAVDQITYFTSEHSAIESRLLFSGSGSGSGSNKPGAAGAPGGGGRQSEAIVKKGSTSHGHLLFFQTSKKAIEISQFGYNLLQCSRDVSTSLGIKGKDSGEGLQKYNLLQSSTYQSKCPQVPSCNLKYRNYRSVDGSCNNLNMPNLGMSFTPLMRILEPEYSDGIWSPRTAKDGSELPGARALSHSLIGDSDVPDTRFSLLVMQFGQFIDHDLSHVPAFRFTNGSGIECCVEDGSSTLPPELTHPFCLPIEILHEDTFYRNHRQSCMNFVRSMIGPRLDCSLGYGDQLNQITHWLDSSNVYGSTKEDEGQLRSHQGGRLKTSGFKRDMLPLQENRGDECTEPQSGTHCFNAGDLRVNEMIGLTSIHLLWLREHNRIATELARLNPDWNDNQLYLESRRILNAEYQYILYNEWLPILIGRTYMEVYGILPLTQGFALDYDPRIDPSVSNGFAAAAFRVGHTLIQGILRLINDLGVVDETLRIHQHFNNPFRIREVGLLDKILRTLTQEPIQGFDFFVTSEVTERLFQPLHEQFGMDLIALNIQRGRDHGIPGYNHYRQICKIGRVEAFSGFTDWIPGNYVQLLSKYYNHVDDVDLFIGGVAERPLPGALLGPTFTCLIGDQFARSKKADRFAYDLGGQESSFLSAQLDQIRRVSYARIICDNSDHLTKVQPYAFMLPDSDLNQLANCNGERIQRMDLSYWRQ